MYLFGPGQEVAEFEVIPDDEEPEGVLLDEGGVGLEGVGEDVHFVVVDVLNQLVGRLARKHELPLLVDESRCVFFTLGYLFFPQHRQEYIIFTYLMRVNRAVLTVLLTVGVLSCVS